MNKIMITLLNIQSGERGFIISGQKNTLAGEICELIQQGILNRSVEVEVDKSLGAVVINVNGIPIMLRQENEILSKIADVLQGSIQIQPYLFDEYSGCQVVNR